LNGCHNQALVQRRCLSCCHFPSLATVWLAFCSDNVEATLNNGLDMIFYYITEGTYLPFTHLQLF
jgi:hypothetical protein